MSFRFSSIVCVFVISALLVSQESLLAAQQLRIETEVFRGDDNEAVSRNITLFDSGTVYDFNKEQSEITIFRPPHSSRPGQFILLNLASKQRTELSTDRIEKLLDKIADWAAAQEDPMLKFTAKPDFEVRFDEESGAIELKHSLWNYTVATVPAEDKEMLSRYREFVDWYARLNVLLHGTHPPGPRLKLNATLEKNGVVPVEIHRTVDSSSTKLRATHLFSWRLSREDKSRLEEARRFLASFEKVDNKTFLAQRSESDVVRGQSK